MSSYPPCPLRLTHPLSPQILQYHCTVSPHRSGIEVEGPAPIYTKDSERGHELDKIAWGWGVWLKEVP